MQGPRADFACLSPKCRTDEGATVYELPVNAVRCPVCSSKRINRLYNAVNISSGLAKRTDAIAEPAYERAVASQNAAKASPVANLMAPRAVPISGIGGALAQFNPGLAGVQYKSGGAKGIQVTPDHPALHAVQRRTPIADPRTSRRDTEYKVVRKKDGTAEAVKA